MAGAVDRLVEDDRFCGEKVCQFVIYLPLGVALALVRAALGLLLWLAALVLPDKSSVRALLSSVACLTFGIYVKKKGERDPKTSLLIANYVSALDPLAVSHALGTISLRKWKVPPFFAAALGIKNTAQFVGKQHFSDSGCRPVLLQPEGIATNGNGLLKFGDWPVPICNRVQPVTIKVERALTNVTVHCALDTEDAVPWSDVLWFLWTPQTTYTVHALAPVERNGCESDARFQERVRRLIAAALDVEATEYGVEDVVECARRGVRPAPRAGAPPRADLHRLAQQVKEVLPRVPTGDILRDLARTRSVDVTITNFLEEITPYTPEEPPAVPAEPGPSREPAPRYVTPPAAAAAAAVFPKSARDRQLGFRERKQQMIAAARNRYIAKHGPGEAC